MLTPSTSEIGELHGQQHTSQISRYGARSQCLRVVSRPRANPGYPGSGPFASLRVDAMSEAYFRSEVHSMTRLDISTGMAFDDFRAAFEKAAPAVDAAAVIRIVAQGGSWDDVRAAVAANAPNGLMIYATIDATPLYTLAGHHHMKAVEYLLGNHVIAETMFRHDAMALLYAPLRVLVHSDSEDNAVFSIDQPSTVFANLGVHEVTAVGESLDRKVAALLQVIGVDARAAFGVQR
jgi:uncharacterized protein (DUF302 family)